jgi:hypothetical protein
MPAPSTIPHDTASHDAPSASSHQPPETAVPSDADAERCPYCDQPFPEARRLALHVGERHAGVHTDAERAAYESARDEEGDELFMYHLRVIAALGVLYAVLVLVYMIVLA